MLRRVLGEVRDWLKPSSRGLRKAITTTLVATLLPLTSLGSSPIFISSANAASGAAVLGSISITTGGSTLPFTPVFSSNQPTYNLAIPSGNTSFTFSVSKTGSSNPTIDYQYDTNTAVTGLTVTGSGYTSPSLSLGTTLVHKLLVNSVNGTNKFTYTINITKSAVTNLNRPETPTAIDGVTGSGTVSLNWLPPVNIGSSVITDYSVQYSTTGSAPWTSVTRTASPSTTQVVSGLINGQNYYFRVAAINTAGTGPYSANSPALMPVGVDNTPPNAPTGLYLDPLSDSGKSANDGITVNRTLVVNGLAEPSSFVQLYLGGISSGDSCTASAGGVFSCTSAINLVDGNYLITAKARDAAGNVSTFSSSISVTVDNVAPTITSSSPANGATGVAINDVYTLNFSENMAFGTGTLTINSTSGGADNRSFNADGTSSSDGVITGDGTNQLIVRPSANFATNKPYALTYATTAFTDIAGNALAVVSRSFTTAAAAAIVISKPAVVGVTPPVRGATPVTSIPATDSYTGTVSWSPNDSPFLGGVSYVATITLTPKTGYTLSGVSANFFTVAGAVATNNANSGIISASFPATAATTIAQPVIAGVTAPVTGANPVYSIPQTDSYTAAVTWSPNNTTFSASTIYTATITLTPKTGYTLTGVPSNYFTVSGATTSNSADSGVITAVFPATAAPLVNYSVSSSSASPTSRSVSYGYTAASTQTTITLNRSGNSGSDPTTTISVTSGTWTIAAGDSTTVSTTSITSGSPVTVTLTDSTGTVTLSRNTGGGVGSDTATVSTSTPTNFVVNIAAIVIAAPAISGVTAPVTGATPVSSLTATDSYTAAITWSPAASTFAATTVYTANIVLTAKTGYTLNGVPSNFFTVAGATATNSANSGTISAIFPATGVALVNYSISSASASPTAGPVYYGYSGTSTQTTITLNRSGNNGSDPITTISVNSGTWTLAAGTNTTVSTTSITSSASATVTLTASTGTVTLYRNSGANIGSETATVNSTTPLNYVVTVSPDNPDAPIVSDSVTANASFTVKWSPAAKVGSPSISSYILTVSPAPTSGPSTFSIPSTGSPVESYTVNNLVNGTTYTFDIKTVNSGGKTSPLAASLRGKPRTTPGAPGTPTVVTYDETATVSYSAASDGGDAITTYTIYATPDGGGSAITCVSSTTTCNVTGLTNGTSYTFTVKATNGAGQGNASSGASATPRTIPGQPTITSVTAYNETATVVWSPPARDGGASITLYTVTASATGESHQCTTSGTSCVVTGLVNGHTYSFTVKATNSQGQGTASAGQNGMPAWVPAAPITPTVIAYVDTATVSWSAPSDNGEAITSYTVESSTTGSGIWSVVIASTNLTSVELSGLTGQSNLIYRVFATNSIGRGNSSSASAPVTPGKLAHAMSISGSNARGAYKSSENSNLTIDTDASDKTGFGASLSYAVDDSNICEVTGGVVRPSTASGRRAGTCTVTVTSSGFGSYNGASKTFTYTVDPINPDTPTAISSIPGNGRATINWSAPVEDGGVALTDYEVEYSADGSSWSSTTLVDDALSTVELTGLENGTTYSVRVRAANAGSKKSGYQLYSVKPHTTPIAPTITSVTAVDSPTATIAWSALTSKGHNGGETVDSYTVVASGTGLSCSALYETSTSCTIYGLAANTDYTFIIAAYNLVGKGSNGSHSWRSGKITQTVSLSVSTTHTFGAADLTPAGTSSASLAITYEVDASSSTVCEIVSGKIRAKSAGTCRVRAKNAGDATYDAATSAPTDIEIDASDPDSPTAISASAGTSSALVTWSAPANTGGANITTYTVTSTPGGFTCTATSPATSCTVTGLDPAVDYQFEVVATNSHNSRNRNSVASSRSASVRPNAASTPAPTSEREQKNSEPTRKNPDPNSVLPPVRFADVVKLPPANAVPLKGDLETLKDGKLDVVILKVEKIVTPKAATTQASSVTKAEIIGNGWGVTVTTAATVVKSVLATTASSTTTDVVVEKGSRAQATGNGFVPYSKVSVYLFSDPQLLGTLRTDKYGNFKGTIKLPSDIETGTHTLQFNALGGDYGIRTTSLPIMINSKVSTSSAAVATSKPTSAPSPIAKTVSKKATINFGLNSWWVDATGYSVLRVLLKAVPQNATSISVNVVGHIQKTSVDPYPNIGLSRAKAVLNVLRELGFNGKASTSQVNLSTAISAENRKAEITLSWKAP